MYKDKIYHKEQLEFADDQQRLEEMDLGIAK